MSILERKTLTSDLSEHGDAALRLAHPEPTKTKMGRRQSTYSRPFLLLGLCSRKLLGKVTAEPTSHPQI